MKGRCPLKAAHDAPEGCESCPVGQPRSRNHQLAIPFFQNFEAEDRTSKRESPISLQNIVLFTKGLGYSRKAKTGNFMS